MLSEIRAAGVLLPSVVPFTASDVASVLRENGWLRDAQPGEDRHSVLEPWLARAAQLLGPHAGTRDDLAGLLSLVFTYDASRLLREPASHAMLTRPGGREVIRELANRVLSFGPIDSDAFKSLIDGLKAALPYRGPALFGPIRLALAGKIGEGGLDRVILLIDSASALDFGVRVKGTRQRMVEFCAALD